MRRFDPQKSAMLVGKKYTIDCNDKADADFSKETVRHTFVIVAID
jgi:hypothetical protein